jgi:hypothetical protein
VGFRSCSAGACGGEHVTLVLDASKSTLVVRTVVLVHARGGEDSGDSGNFFGGSALRSLIRIPASSRVRWRGASSSHTLQRIRDAGNLREVLARAALHRNRQPVTEELRAQGLISEVLDDDDVGRRAPRSLLRFLRIRSPLDVESGGEEALYEEASRWLVGADDERAAHTRAHAGAGWRGRWVVATPEPGEHLPQMTTGPAQVSNQVESRAPRRRRTGLRRRLDAARTFLWLTHLQDRPSGKVLPGAKQPPCRLEEACLTALEQSKRAKLPQAWRACASCAEAMRRDASLPAPTRGARGLRRPATDHGTPPPRAEATRRPT